MKYFLVTFSFLIITIGAFAQPIPLVNSGKISGVVIDSTNNAGVEFANVALLDSKTRQPINGNVCDEKGKFEITKITNGDYLLVISFIGYKNKTISVQITDKNNHIDLGNIQLSPSVTMLKAVEVVGQKPLVEEKVDRLVYNAESDATAKGGDATDVLRRVPLLTVDLDGNVSLRGSENIKVLINNKPSTITASSISDALKQIPADQIKTVEVITSPSAKYDAEGSAGIINIITKKNTLEGLTMNINSSGGFRGSNLGLQGGYRKGKLGLTLGGFGRAQYNTPGYFANDQRTYNTPGDFSTYNRNVQSANTRQQNLFGNYTIGMDYDIDKNNSLTGSVRFGIRDGHSFQDGLKTVTSLHDSSTHYMDSVTSSSIKYVDQLNTSHSVDASLNYTHLFAKQNREFSLLTLYSQNTGNNNFTNRTVNPSDNSTIGYLKNINPTKNSEFTLQADYQTPINDNQMVEFGAKDIMRNATSNATYLQAASDGVYSNYAGSVYKNNTLDYTQNITAGYFSYTVSTASKYSLKAGMRYENTTISATTSSGSTPSSFSTSYGVLVPSVNLSKRLAGGNMVKLSYNRRIQRPSIQNLNPNKVASNPFSISYGDPRLNPEYTNNYELSYNMFIKGTTLNFSTFMRNTDNAITQVRDRDLDTVRTTYKNIGIQDAYGASIFANVVLSNKFSLSGGSDMYYAVLKNPATSPSDVYAGSNSGFVFNARMFGNYTIGNGWGLQFFGFYRGRRVNLQGYQGAFRIYSLSLQKEFNEKRGSIGIGAENFASPSMTVKSSSVSPILNQQSSNTFYNFNFKITFNYRIGKLTMNNQPKRNKKSINNDDLKDNGGDMGDGGQMGGQGGQGGGQIQGGGRGNMQMQGGNQPNLKMAAADPSKVINAEGTWNYIVESPQGGGGKLIIKKDGDKYTGTAISNRNNREIALTSVTVNGNEITATYEVSFGGNTNTITIKGTIKEDELNGTMSVGQFGSFPLNAKREK